MIFYLRFFFRAELFLALGFLDFLVFLANAFEAFRGEVIVAGAKGSKISPQSLQIIWSRIRPCTMFCDAQSGHSLMLCKWSSPIKTSA
jgi:hypothetical protein